MQGFMFTWPPQIVLLAAGERGAPPATRDLARVRSSARLARRRARPSRPAGVVRVDETSWRSAGARSRRSSPARQMRPRHKRTSEQVGRRGRQQWWPGAQPQIMECILLGR